MGFVLDPDEARRLIEKDPHNKEVLFPYLNGEDLNSRPDQSPRRWVINFFDWPLDWNSAPDEYRGPVAADYPDCLAIVDEKVKPERDRLGLKKDSSARGYARYWWQFGRKGLDLYGTIAGMERVLVRSRVANINSWDFTSPRIVTSEQTVLVADDTYSRFSTLQASIQSAWIVEYASSMRTDVRYTPSDCFETFPFPPMLDASRLATIGEAYHAYRRQIMLSRQEGLTKTYNRFHNPAETTADIQKLRDLHVEMDKAVATAYGWSDLDLGHGFHETKQGTRFTISESARREVLARLLKLNHERYAEEVAQGLHDKKKGKAAKASRKPKGKASSEPSLFGEED